MAMTRCGYKTQVLDEEWGCPLDALTGERYCYWHKEEDGKEPTEEQLEELKDKDIFGVYLKETKLAGIDLQGAYLLWANFQGADIRNVNFQKSDLRNVNFQGAYLLQTNFQEAYLLWANFQGARLLQVNFQEAYMVVAKLRETYIMYPNFQEASLSGAEFQEAYIGAAKLRGANLYGARFDSKTSLDDSILIDANLYRSYFDEAKSFRNAKVFQNDSDKEINEVVGNALNGWFIKVLKNSIKHPVKTILDSMSFVAAKVSKKKPCIPLFLKPQVIDMGRIKERAPRVAAKFRGKGLIRYVGKGNKIIFFDRSSGCVIENPENWRRHERSPIRVEGLANLILKDGKIQSEFLYDGNRTDLYEASYEVYNNLYNFYIANGRLDQAAHVHYRRGEVHRKLRWVKGGLMNRARSIFDLLALRTLIGYGDRIAYPLIFSGLMIGFFAILFQITNGIVKNVNDKSVVPDFGDCLYHSFTTFMGIGSSNISLNLAAGHLPKILVAAESGLGVMMMALIIFVVTYQVSR